MLQAGRVLYFMTILGLSVTGYVGTFGDLVARPIESEVCSSLPSGVVENKQVPSGAIWKKETIREATPPEGFNAAVAWINVATVTPCTTAGEPAVVEIQKITLIEKDLENNSEKILEEFVYENEEDKNFDGALFQREPYWFGPGEGKKASSIVSSTKEGIFINVKPVSHHIYHGWTNPRVSIANDKAVVVEVVARVTGQARLQLGLDYWQDLETDYNGYDPNCQVSANCEAWIGDWQGDTKGEFVTLRSPLEFDE
jgi:hypothetical protein